MRDGISTGYITNAVYTLVYPRLTLTHAAKGPKGLSCFEKQTAKHFLKLKKFKNLGITGKYM